MEHEPYLRAKGNIIVRGYIYAQMRVRMTVKVEEVLMETPDRIGIFQFWSY